MILRSAAAATLMALLMMASGCSTDDAPAASDAGDMAKPEATATVSPVEEDVPEPTVAPLSQTSVRVYFPSSSGDGLIFENHDIFETTTPADRAKQIVADLIEGPQSERALRAVPRGTVLRQVYVLSSGVAYLDFSGDLAEGLGGGSMREMLTVYAIVDSVTRNVPEIKSVALLIEGRVPDTLNGHLDLRYPLRPNYSIVLRAQAKPLSEPDALRPVRLAGAY